MSTLEVAAELAEEAVFLFMTQGSAADPVAIASWHRERETLYLAPQGADREGLFRNHAQVWFKKLELGQPIVAALRACPRVLRRIPSIQVRRVARFRDEGSEVFGPSGPNDASGPGPGRMILGLRPQRFLDARSLEEFALRELLHADDMLDPDFGFDPVFEPTPGCEPARRDLVRDRLRVLWDARVEGRLARRRDPVATAPPAGAGFRQAFGVSADPLAVEELHARAWGGHLASYDRILECAKRGCAQAELLGVPGSG